MRSFLLRATTALLLTGLAFLPGPWRSPSPADASSLLAPSAGSADEATAGSNIAEPLSPVGAQFANPAGLAGFEQRQSGMGIGVAYGRGEISADESIGYHARNEVLVPFLDSYMVVPWGRWTFGVSTMGTSGARFEYDAQPNAGVNHGFFSESGMMGLPIGAAYRVSDRLWIGAEIIPLYASAKLRYSREVAEQPGSQTRFHFTADGFGVQGMFGVTWKPDDLWSLGLSIKPPGRIWAEGRDRFGTGKQDVELELEAPLEVAFGISRRVMTNWRVSYALRFIDTSVLSDSWFRFEDTPSADMPYITDARDEWRHSLGVQYRWSDAWDVLGGFSGSNGIIGDKGVNPTSYDGTDLRLTTGTRWRGEKYMVDWVFGYLLANSRDIDANEALVLPGKYESKASFIFTITVAKKF